MTDQDQILSHLANVHRDFETSLNGQTGSPLHDFQKRSFQALQTVRFPDRKHEDWKYTPVQKLIGRDYKLASHVAGGIQLGPIPGLDTYVITIINGKVLEYPSLSLLKAHGIRLLHLNEALSDDSWVQAFQKLVAFSDSPNRAFEFLNFSFSASGFFLDIPKNLHLDQPIELRVIHDEPETSFSHPLCFIRCGQNSNVRLIERYEGNVNTLQSPQDGLINSIVYMHLDRNAQVTHLKWQDLPSSQQLVYKLSVSQFRDSRLETFAFDNGGSTVRNNIEVELEENNTYTSLHGGYLAAGKQSMDHQTRINHKVAYCESHELYKGILDGQSTAAFNGKVYVHQDAQKTNAYQQNDTLVLSQHALMNSKPQLEIFADDVKCSHGATIGQLDEKAMFYLKSRGIHEAAAKQMLKEAFLAEIIEKIPGDALRDFISSQMLVRS
jgi:Fe-S cluster assembly protein SufD